MSLPKASFETKESLLKAWEDFLPERLNQRACRMVLGVHKKASRLAVLGELGRYPMLIRGLIQVLKYDWHVQHKTSGTSLVNIAYNEMLGVNDSWGLRVSKIKNLLNFPTIPGYKSEISVSEQIKSKLYGNFDTFWLSQINQIKTGSDNQDHNKLRFYKTFKSCFKTEPYIDMVHSRNQRSNLTRVRTSAHTLEVELLRYRVPPVPYSERYCRYCTIQVPGDEIHFLNFCETFRNKRQCFLGKLSGINKSIYDLNPTDQVKSMLCPTSHMATKLINKYISIMFKARANIDDGDHITNLTFPPHVQNFTCPDLNESFSSVSSSSSSALSDSLSD